MRMPGADLLHTLLLKGASGRRMWASLIAMAIGLTLLLLAVIIWWNFNELLHGRASTDSLSSTFLTVSKRVTNDNMGHPEQTIFSATDIDNLKTAPQVEDVGVVQSLKPRAYMSMQITQEAGFSTVMVLESVPDGFMDKRPADWSWQPGSTTVPVILSSSFLSLYNYAFAPSQGLPQLSEETIKALPFKLSVGEGANEVSYTARITGFSDRITSVLVPESFVLAANNASWQTANASRLIVKVSDPSSTGFADYLSSHGYVTNSEMLRWSKLRAIVQVVAIVTGILAILLLGVSLLVFVLFIELTVARARHSVQLLQEIGYSPGALRHFLFRRFLPMLAVAIGTALILALLSQLGAHYWSNTTGLNLALLPGWPMWACLVVVCILLALQMRTAVAKAILKA
jgi:cell division protein FtsX